MVEWAWRGSAPAERGIPAYRVRNGDADIELLPSGFQFTTATVLDRNSDRAPKGCLRHLGPAVRDPHRTVRSEQLSAGGPPATLRLQEGDEILDGALSTGAKNGFNFPHVCRCPGADEAECRPRIRGGGRLLQTPRGWLKSRFPVCMITCLKTRFYVLWGSFRRQCLGHRLRGLWQIIRLRLIPSFRICNL